MALYDLGAPAKVIQAVWDCETKDAVLDPLDSVDKSTLEPLTEKNWTNFLGDLKYVTAMTISATHRYLF